MAAYSTIREQLETILAGYASSKPIKVAWENRAFTPTTGEAYLAASLLPAETGPVGLAIGSNEDYSGIFQVSVNVPKGDQTIGLREIVDDVLAAFSRGTQSGGVLVEKSFAAPGLDLNDAWLTVPISVVYRYFE